MKRWLVKSVETLDQKVGCVNGGSAAGRYGATSQARKSPCLSMPPQIIDLELVIRNPCILFFRYRLVIVYSERNSAASFSSGGKEGAAVAPD
jgi:hypothetical protein